MNRTLIIVVLAALVLVAVWLIPDGDETNSEGQPAPHAIQQND